MLSVANVSYSCYWLVGEGARRRRGPAQQKSLHSVATALMHQFELLLRFNAFRGDTNPQTVRKCDDALH